MSNLSTEQIQKNAAVLYGYQHYCADGEGNLEGISSLNLIGRFIYWLKNVFGGSEEHKVNQAVLKTFEGIKEHYMKVNASDRAWTFRFVAFKPFFIGFDKLAIKILADKRFAAARSEEVRKIHTPAYEVLHWALTKRMERYQLLGERDLGVDRIS